MISRQEMYESMLLTLRLGKRGVRKARQANREAGIPNVCSRNGQIYYEMPDGTIVMRDENTSLESLLKAGEEQDSKS